MLSDAFILKRKLFKKALSKLEDVLKEVDESTYIRDAAIQRFEFTYELAWKTLKIYLASKDLIALNPKEVLQVSYQQGLLKDAKKR